MFEVGVIADAVAVTAVVFLVDDKADADDDAPKLRITAPKRDDEVKEEEAAAAVGFLLWYILLVVVVFVVEFISMGCRWLLLVVLLLLLSSFSFMLVSVCDMTMFVLVVSDDNSLRDRRRLIEDRLEDLEDCKSANNDDRRRMSGIRCCCCCCCCCCFEAEPKR